MPYKFDPEKFSFNHVSLYPEISDFFGPRAFIKATGEHDNGKDHCFWYTAVCFPFSDDRVEIYNGVFYKGRVIQEKDWPKVVYLGLISNEDFAIELMSHLLGTLNNESVETTGWERLNAFCLYRGPQGQ